MNSHITIIGGANLDINGFSRDPLSMHDSNPGRVEYCPGGVGRNIAENLHRLGADVKFIGVIGDDPGGELIKNSSAQIGLNIEHSLFLKSKSQVTSVYIALMDSNGEMKLALSDMDIMEHMSYEHLENKAAIIKESAIVLLDTNLPERIIQFIIDMIEKNTQCDGKLKPLFFLDPVSAKKAPRALSRISKFHTLKMGFMEASVLSGITLNDESAVSRQHDKLEELTERLISTGVQRVFITLGKEGVYTATAQKRFFRPVHYIKPLNTSGGGDAFMAGMVYGTYKGWTDEKIVSFSMAMASITVQDKAAVSPDLCLDLVINNMRINE